MNSDIFIPARMDSKRLPSKHLKKIFGEPIIKFLIDRLKKSKKARKIVVCTTDLPSDEPLVEWCKKENIAYYRGSNKDILDRLLKAAEKFGTDIIVDVEGDKIFTDPEYVDLVITEMENSNFDYIEGNVSNKKIHHGVHGFFPAAFRRKTLENVCNEKDTDDTETGYKEFFTTNNSMNCKFIDLDSELQFPENIRLTLDYPEDWILTEEILQNLGKNFSSKDVLKLFSEKPDLIDITKPVLEKWEKNYKEKIVELGKKKEN